MRQIGTRIHVIGNSASGKSTLAARLADTLKAPLVELDAINWQPGWVGLNTTDPDEFERRIREATRGGALGRRGFLQEVLPAYVLVAPQYRCPARSAATGGCLALPPPHMEALAIQTADLGHEPRALLATVQDLAEGRFTARVDHHPTPSETEGPGQGHVPTALGPHPVCAAQVDARSGGVRRIRTVAGSITFPLAPEVRKHPAPRSA